MDAGALRHRITIQGRTADKNNYNELTDWQDVLTTQAAINTLSGREFFAAEQTQSEVTHKITIRYKPGIKPSMRVQFGARNFDIMYVQNFEERNVELTLMCRELF